MNFLWMKWVKTFLNFILSQFAKDIWVKVFKNVSNVSKGCLPQILLRPFLNILSHLMVVQNYIMRSISEVIVRGV